MDENEQHHTFEIDADKDLETRLAKLRARMAAAGRDAAVEALDRAIARDCGLSITEAGAGK